MDNSDNPKVGDIRNYKRHNQIFVNCTICGNGHWCPYLNGKPKYTDHYLCAIKKFDNKRWSNPENCKQHSALMINKHKDPEYKHKKRNGLLKWHSDIKDKVNWSDFVKGQYDNNPNLIIKHSLATLKRYEDDNEREKTRQQTIKRYEDPEERRKTGEASRKMWQDPVFKDRTVEKILRATIKKPNTCEIIILNVLNTYFPNEWEYVGNGKYRIDGKNPDFKHKTNNWLIEHFGDYHHTDKFKHLKITGTYEFRMNFLTEHGYKPLILWEHEVRKRPLSEIAEKIRKYFYS